MALFTKISIADGEEGGYLLRFSSEQEREEYDKLKNALKAAIYQDADHFAAFFEMMSQRDLTSGSRLSCILEAVLDATGEFPVWTELSKVRKVIDAYKEAGREQDKFLLSTVFRFFGENLAPEDVATVLSILRNEKDTRPIRRGSMRFLGNQYDRCPEVKQYLIETFLAKKEESADSYRRVIAFAFYNRGATARVLGDWDVLTMAVQAMRSDDPEIRKNALLLIPSGGEADSSAGPMLFSAYVDAFTNARTDSERSWAAYKLSQFDSPQAAIMLPEIMGNETIPDSLKSRMLRDIGWASSLSDGQSTSRSRDELFNALVTVTGNSAVGEQVRWDAYVALVRHTATYSGVAGQYNTGESILESIRRAEKDPSPRIRAAAKEWLQVAESSGKVSFDPKFPVPEE